jgi:hypothetical protein
MSNSGPLSLVTYETKNATFVTTTVSHTRSFLDQTGTHTYYTVQLPRAITSWDSTRKPDGQKTALLEATLDGVQRLIDFKNAI